MTLTTIVGKSAASGPDGYLLYIFVVQMLEANVMRLIFHSVVACNVDAGERCGVFDGLLLLLPLVGCLDM